MDANLANQVPWLKIIDIVVSLIEGCGDQTEAATLGRIRNPEPMQSFILQRRVRLEMGYRPRAWRTVREQVMGEISMRSSSLTDDELREMISEARDILDDNTV